MPAKAQSHLSQAMAFRVRFCGSLEASWFGNLQNVVLTSTDDGGRPEMMLVAEAPDEAAFMGVLNLLYELGCHLISVERPDWGAAGT